MVNNISRRLKDLNRLEEMLIREVKNASLTMNVVHAGDNWDSAAISAVNVGLVDTKADEGHYQ